MMWEKMAPGSWFSPEQTKTFYAVAGGHTDIFILKT